MAKVADYFSRFVWKLPNREKSKPMRSPRLIVPLEATITIMPAAFLPLPTFVLTFDLNLVPKVFEGIALYAAASEVHD